MTRTFQTGGDITLAYPTPIFSRVMPKHRPVNDALQRLILAREKLAVGLQKSNVGGWHSENDLLKWDNPNVPIVFA